MSSNSQTVDENNRKIFPKNSINLLPFSSAASNEKRKIFPLNRAAFLTKIQLKFFGNSKLF
jgi:hypothetical protein